MVILPDGDLIEMRWKSVSYIFGQKKIIFSIVPMMNKADYVLVPNAGQWIFHHILQIKTKI